MAIFTTKITTHYKRRVQISFLGVNKMQEEIRRITLKSFALGFVIGGAIMIVLYSGIVIPLMMVSN